MNNTTETMEMVEMETVDTVEEAVVDEVENTEETQVINTYTPDLVDEDDDDEDDFDYEATDSGNLKKIVLAILTGLGIGTIITVTAVGVKYGKKGYKKVKDTVERKKIEKLIKKLEKLVAKGKLKTSEDTEAVLDYIEYLKRSIEPETPEEVKEEQVEVVEKE